MVFKKIIFQNRHVELETRPAAPLMAQISMKRILHFKNITFKSFYNRFKIDIHQQLRQLTANYLAMFKVISTTIYT